MSDLNILKNRDIIIISGQMLNDRYWTSKQYIAHELIKHNRVLYVETNYSFGKLLSGFLGKKWPVTLLGRITRDASGIDVLTPPPRLPWRNHFHWIGQLNQLILRWKIQRAMHKLDYRNPILWSFLHQTAALVGKIPAAHWIYHCVDDWPELLPMAGMGRSSQIMRDEWHLIQRVNVIFSVSTGLLHQYAIPEHKLYYIPNGVDISLFDPERYDQKLAPDDIADLPGPVIGFSGSLGKWIDLDLILKTAQTYPECALVIIGLNEKNPQVSQLFQHKNIYFLGMKPREEVPIYINAFDVCLMPFAKSMVGKGLMPLKLFEYLAMGKPIIATSSPALEAFEQILYLAKNTDDFVRQVGRALTESDTGLFQKRRDIATEYSWAARITQYDAAIQSSSKSTDYERNL